MPAWASRASIRRSVGRRHAKRFVLADCAESGGVTGVFVITLRSPLSTPEAFY